MLAMLLLFLDQFEVTLQISQGAQKDFSFSQFSLEVPAGPGLIDQVPHSCTICHGSWDSLGFLDLIELRTTMDHAQHTHTTFKKTNDKI